MAWSVRVDPEHRLNHVRAFGEVTFEDLTTALQALGRERDFDANFPLLIDFRGAEVRLTAAELQSIITVAPVGVATRRAILVDTLGGFQTARLYEAVRESRTALDVVRPCRTLEEAAEWLGVEQLHT